MGVTSGLPELGPLPKALSLASARALLKIKARSMIPEGWGFQGTSLDTLKNGYFKIWAHVSDNWAKALLSPLI